MVPLKILSISAPTTYLMVPTSTGNYSCEFFLKEVMCADFKNILQTKAATDFEYNLVFESLNGSWKFNLGSDFKCYLAFKTLQHFFKDVLTLLLFYTGAQPNSKEVLYLLTYSLLI